MSNNLFSRLRQQIAFAAGNLAAWASRKTGRGTGNSIKGAVMTKIDPHLFDELLPGRRLALVSGTNGKTTTTHLLTAALRAKADNPQDVVTNPDGANLREGIVSALSTNPKAPFAVLEADEQIIPHALKAGDPEIFIMLNFSRDQMDRHHEIYSLGKKWRDTLETMHTPPTIVANLSDPLVVWSALGAKRQIWVDMGLGVNQDSSLCPECGTVLKYATDDWHCPGCDLAQPQADVRVTGDQVIFADGRQYELNLQVPGRFNRGNATCALAAADAMGVPPETALPAMREVVSPAGRFAIGTFTNDKGETGKARLMLAKNPAGWSESLRLLQSDTVILAIDSAIADGTDVSWLWDIEFEKLKDKREVLILGPRSLDMAIRLSYAGVSHRIFDSIEDTLSHFDGTVDVLATYSQFLALCRKGGVDVG